MVVYQNSSRNLTLTYFSVHSDVLIPFLIIEKLTPTYYCFDSKYFFAQRKQPVKSVVHTHPPIHLIKTVTLMCFQRVNFFSRKRYKSPACTKSIIM